MRIPYPNKSVQETPDAQDVAIAYLMGGTARVARLYADNLITPQTSLRAIGEIAKGGGDALGLAYALTYIHSPAVLRYGVPEA